MVQVAAFAGMAVLAGKRIRWAYFVVMVVTITLFNVLSPVGEVLLRAGPFAVTRGALRQGLMKGFAIPGLVFISLFAVAPELRLPGRLGGLTARLFFYFEQLLEGRKRIRLRGFIASIDDLLTELFDDHVVDREESTPEGESAEHSPAAHGRSTRRTTALGYTILAILGLTCVTAAVLFGTY
jgi:hypothetical protein